MAYWACAQFEPNRERLALHCLGLAGYETYLPRLRERRLSRRGPPALFPGYCFVAIALQWHTACWCSGVIRLVLDGAHLAGVSDWVLAEIRSRERNGLIELPSPPALRRGGRVRITRGLLAGQI